ncbi:hypothetical protein GF362_07360 [Candidatus Dojkabacteria bacterium]|nr:hypothetical protein [Candidatus Dojkabacteria bacterium]
MHKTELDNPKKLISVLNSIDVSPDSGWKNSTMNSLLNNITNKEPKDRKIIQRFINLFNFSIYSPMKNKALFYTLIALCLIGLGTVGIAYASNEAKPGDALYFVDLGFEKVEVAIAGIKSEEAQGGKYLDLAEERISELESLLEDQESLALIPSVYAAEDEDSDSVDLELINGLVENYNFNLAQAEEILEKMEGNKNKRESMLQLAKEMEGSTDEFESVLVKALSQTQNAGLIKALEKTNKVGERAFQKSLRGENAEGIAEKEMEKAEFKKAMMNKHLEKKTDKGKKTDNAENCVGEANQIMIQAENMYKEGDYEESQNLAREARHMYQECIRYVYRNQYKNSGENGSGSVLEPNKYQLQETEGVEDDQSYFTEDEQTDSAGEPGGVGNQIQPQDRDGYVGTEEGNHEEERPGWN